MMQLVRGHRPLKSILGSFQQAHDELLRLEESHKERASEHVAQATELHNKAAELNAERGIASNIRRNLQQFLPPSNQIFP